MPEVILPGASGRIEGRYSPGKRPNAPIALILHPHPKAAGHMNNPVTVTLYQLFQKRGFATLRTQREVVTHRVVKQRRMLEHGAHVGAHARKADLRDRHAIEG